MKTILYVVNNPIFFLSHRLPIATAARDAGFTVHVATPELSGAERIRGLGFLHHAIPMSRSGKGPWGEVRTLAALISLYRRLRPDLVHHVTIKPVLYGSIAARLARVPAVCNAVSGLGYVFIAQGWKAELIRSAVALAYRIAFGHTNLKVIFQNPDDARTFTDRGLVCPKDVVLIRGSGVDPLAFGMRPESEGPAVVLFPARMLWDKGLREFAEAARMVRCKGIHARFVLAGAPDGGNPASASSEWLESQARLGDVEVWGHRDDMDRVMAEAHVVCLPSYREGLPKALIEAAASGRPIVTTDVPGCREVVRQGENGFLVPARDSQALAEALERVVVDPGLRHRLGSRGRQIFEEEFSLDKVVAATLATYEELLRRR